MGTILNCQYQYISVNTDFSCTLSSSSGTFNNTINLSFGDGSSTQTFHSKQIYSTQIMKKYTTPGSYNIALTGSYQRQETDYVMNSKNFYFTRNIW